MAEQALHAVALMCRILDAEVQPTMAYRPLPLLWAAATMITAHRPMSDAIAQLQALDREPRVLSVGLGVGYQWVDSPLVGASVVVITDDDPSAAESYADQLGHWVWGRRAQWQRESLSPERALEQGELAGQYPIVLADQSDNTGGGAPGDSTEILQLFVERDMVAQGGLPPNYVPALMRGSRVKGPLLFWSEGVARTGALGMVK